MNVVLSPTSFHDLHRFELSGMIELGAALRQLDPAADSMEEAASAIVNYLYAHLIESESGIRNCVLVRAFKTHRFSDLEPELKEFARAAAAGSELLNGDTRCLTMLATAGERAEWNQRGKSSGHQAIPLLTEEMVQGAPMILRLIQQMGIDIAHVIGKRSDLMLDSEQKTYNVFHVADALGSPFVPAQDFVRENNVRSVMGFGGLFPSGELFAVILFSRVYIPRETAEMFRTIALGVKLALLPFLGDKTFSKAS